ncbi:hypothetical protein KC331_g74 [Hortaea werneckii]|nr:hypothetical protein KC331_g74 [Hortaea werneckii]
MFLPPRHRHGNSIRILFLRLSSIPIPAHPPSLRRIDRAFPRTLPYSPLLRLFFLHRSLALETPLPLPSPPTSTPRPTPTSLTNLLPLPPPPLRLLL